MRCGRSKRTVSTVVVVIRPVVVMCAARAMSLPRSQTRSLSAIARGVRPRYGPAITSKTVSGGAAMARSIGPERADAAADSEVDRDRAADDERVAAGGSGEQADDGAHGDSVRAAIWDDVAGGIEREDDPRRWAPSATARDR